MIPQPESTKHGLLVEPPSETDYVAGDGRLTGEVINPDGDWLPYIPKFEHQAPLFETNGCASFGTWNATNILEKFFFGTETNTSDRMTVKGSGTDPNKGNTPQKVAQFIRDYWSVFEEEWPMEGVHSVEEYYKEFPDLFYAKAEIIKGDLKLGYEAITNPTKLKLQEALTKGAVCMSVALITDENGIYYKPSGWRDGHWTTLLNIRPNGNYTILDSYPPYIKEIRSDFIPEVAYRYTLNEQQVDWIITAIKKIIKQIQDYIATLSPTPLPPIPETMQQMVRRKCKEHGLTLKQSHELFQTVQCESNFNPKAKLENKDNNGKVWSTDWGICQINDYWWIGTNKTFPSVDYVLNNPDKCIDWMCKQFKAGNEKYWVCWQKLFTANVLSGAGVNRHVSLEETS